MTFRPSFLFAAVLTATLAGCAMPPAPPAPTYVLVHGAFQDGRAWAPVLPLLKAKGITAKDNAVSHTLQQKMVARTPVRETVTLSSGHSPFVETPLALADALAAVAKQPGGTP